MLLKTPLLSHPISKRSASEFRVFLTLLDLAESDGFISHPETHFFAHFSQSATETADILGALEAAGLVEIHAQGVFIPGFKDLVFIAQDLHLSPKAPKHLKRKSTELIRAPWYFPETPCWVYCTKDEWDSLIAKLGEEQTAYLTEQLHNWLDSLYDVGTKKFAAKAKERRCHYLTILNWNRKEISSGKIFGKFQGRWGYWWPRLLNA